MKRTSFFLDEHLLRDAQALAEREGKSFAWVVREAMVAYLNQRQRPSEPGRLPSIAGQFASGASDTSERVDELLWRDPHR
ncbi:MAG: hypothetical protein NW201_03080 [Gemmatimonadales bacterium]|nr:hypothetical protein [Gemmatimonadales bacterium]